jgi:hypothetical protein
MQETVFADRSRAQARTRPVCTVALDPVLQVLTAGSTST